MLQIVNTSCVLRKVKLLLDQNISFRVIRKISFAYPEAKQVRELGLENFSDQDIWQFAKKHNFTIVTFDADFYDLASLMGHPPKIIWLRTGNTRTDDISLLLLNKAEDIEAFIMQRDYRDVACLEIE